MRTYQQSPLDSLTPVVKNILIINILFFVGTWVLQSTGVVDLTPILSAHYFNSPDFRPWQIITYMFMHANIWHIFFNMFALVMFGPMLEQTMGQKRFFNYYFITGIGALALQMLVQAIEVHNAIGSFTVPNRDISPYAYEPGFRTLANAYSGIILGASGAVFGLLVAFGMLFPNLEMLIMFIPLPIKAKYAVIGYIVLELYGGLAQQAGDSVAHFAHLGGALVGFIVIKLWGTKRPNNFY